MVAHQAPLSAGFSRQEYYSELPFPTSGDLPDPGIESRSLMSPALAGRIFTPEPPGKPLVYPLSFGNIFISSFRGLFGSQSFFLLTSENAFMVQNLKLLPNC